MKTLLFNYRFLFLFLISFTLAFCSSDDKEKAFEPVTINLDGLNIDTDDTSFTANGYQFKATRSKSEANGIALAYPNTNNDFSFLELDLRNSTGISKISISLFNNCRSCLDIQTLNGDQIVTEIKGKDLDSGINLVEIDISSGISALKIGSLETIVYSIKLE
ncbi:hypothetical protein [Flavivirga algicola]|uniref:Lipoprotein n=1 Tax=Flavivirga algicola TaxID=2729136 RepID=A0ABX1S2C3_9FLAO|nr:hypothetical protein [Flavivirga algicola]NMH89058.1 hypothetical protein [Flavivirga algicola]